MNKFISTYNLKLSTCLLTLLFLLTNNINAQISAGGKPFKIENSVLMKSGFKQQISMPKLAFKQMAQKATESSLNKSLKFGHAFDVNFTPENVGQVYYTEYYKIWFVEIESKNAYALSLIFDQYNLPHGARLFVSNTSEVLGAFTSRNNKKSNILAVHPLPGDRIKIQYEEPLNAEFKGEISIGKVVHAYLDIFDEKNLFYPRRTSGACNVDVQCENESNLELQKRAVCRVFAVDELGSATLVNNTKQDGTPYLLSAYHVFDNMSTSDSSLFSFNYESPFCTGIEGADYLSISGATSIAGRMETDMILMELSDIPPPSFRPYFVGWNNSDNRPENCYCIHHPNGDTKKISHDTGICETGKFNSGTIPNGHWKVLNWETGTTEQGSSGAGLFDNNGYLVGTLSGGKASCTNLDYDVFARFDIMYNYFSLTNSQLKHWLNPDNQNIQILDGYDPYSDEQLNCITISNFTSENNLVSNNILKSIDGITEIASSFKQVNKGILKGVSIGIEKIKTQNLNPKIELKIYSNVFTNKQAIYAQEIKFEDLLEDAFNYIPLEENVEIDGNFYIAFEVLNSEDTIEFYFSEYKSEVSNTLFLKTNEEWNAMNTFNEQNETAYLLVEANICNYQLSNTSTSIASKDFLNIAPNPAKEVIKINFKVQEKNEIKIYNSIGNCLFKQGHIEQKELTINLANYKKGIYFIQAQNSIGIQTIKFIKQ